TIEISYQPVQLPVHLTIIITRPTSTPGILKIFDYDIRNQGSPRWCQAGSYNRSDHDTYLSNVNLCTRVARKTQGLCLCTWSKPDTRCVAGEHRSIGRW